jgi:predicted Fe-Mo cluster-binding NifX family protein
MNIIFAVQNNDGWNSKISSRFGRTEGYIRYSEDLKKLSYHSNSKNVDAGHGAGVQASQSVVNLEANVVVAGGSIGPKAFDVLKSSGVKMYCQVGEISVKEAYDNFKNGLYNETLKSDK